MKAYLRMILNYVNENYSQNENLCQDWKMRKIVKIGDSKVKRKGSSLQHSSREHQKNRSFDGFSHLAKDSWKGRFVEILNEDGQYFGILARLDAFFKMRDHVINSQLLNVC